ncbi:6-phosphogluconolactonase [Synechococcus sp. Tobar12-5m-g]|uniref:6-phosphogluconolactonase n=1 Tax=unclassified Synechococcus TaxID=2626047 RepID=UPI0020CF758A|nr:MULTISPECIES: 6-phosphogluconolactonase [unclassified Synechococcus]MCP9772217.1 6-phosphogluconolactonase [Synechococcus sp. Tobar12-5m-g]MCP9873112.1 6-phosphogluconolactonase [Synechococcus sp. Cruz CV-v-12]
MNGSPPATYRLERAADAGALAHLAAETIAVTIDLALAQRERAQIALAGGTTPEATYRLLGAMHLPWDRVDVLLGDERWVAAADPSSNALMLHRSLLAEGPGRQARFHPVPTDQESPEQGAAAYAELLSRLCPGAPPILDLVLLGLGDDGHTASLFPGTAATGVTDRSATVSEGKGLPRVTLTAPVLSAARHVIVLVSGEGKRQALQRLLDPNEPASRTPARLVRPLSPVLILADAAAAAGLRE